MGHDKGTSAWSIEEGASTCAARPANGFVVATVYGPTIYVAMLSVEPSVPSKLAI
jgi:hypothetical protein